MSGHRAVLHRLSPERWRTLEPLVDAAMALPETRRQQFLDDASGGDVALRAELAWMIDECTRNDPSFDQPAIARFASLLDIAPIEAAKPPSLIAGRFRIERELGRGGMAIVYLAHDLKHGRDVALKMVRPELAAMIATERFLAEIRVMATLRHPHILPLFDSGEADDQIYFVMPYVKGGTLRDRLRQPGKLPRAEALRIASQVAEGLASAHEHGIVHRDIKPENILLDADGRHAYVSDFGIALAMSMAEGDRATGSWFRLGTPDYMSPEQLDGRTDIDHRTDIYSLGCVVHEMLIGALPSSHVRSEKKARRSAAAQWWESRRRGIDSSLQKALQRSLAHDPADRFQTAHELARELARASQNHSIESVRRRRRNAATAAAAIVAAGAVVASPAVRAGVRDWITGTKVDPDLIVVLPFRGDSSGRAILSGENAARLLYDALGRWKDLRLGDEMGAVEAGRLKGAGLASVADARAVARSLGAGRFVWGEVTDQRGVLRISAQLYDGRRSPISHVGFLSAGGGAAAKIEEVADSLVAKLVGAPAASAGTNGTRMFAALKRYADGYAALHEWDTELAEQYFRGAVDLDPRFAQAWLGVAQSMAWSGRHKAPDWLEPATRATADSNALAPRDRLLASALVALAERRMAEACDIYRRLVARDPRDFAAHYGLGDCLSMDRLVVRDRASSTGWKFRGSLRTAIQEYMKALELVPSYLEGSRGQTFARLTDRILIVDEGTSRKGFALTPDTVSMFAFPEIQNDTLAFNPRPRGASSAAPPLTRREAIARNRQLLRSLMARWAAAFPRSGSALEHYAGALESAGLLDTLDETRRGPGALGAIAAARRLASVDSVSRVRQAATQVRLLIKLGRFGAAQALAESTLTLWSSPTPKEANVLAPLAALTGRARLTARLLAAAAADSANEFFRNRQANGRGLPGAVLTAAGAFAGYAALGVPTDSLRVALARVEQAIATSVAPRDRRAVRGSVLLPSAFQAQPTLRAPLMATLENAREPLLPSWQLLARGDTAGVRRLISRDLSRVASTVAIAPDLALQNSILALAVRDTSTATAILDRVVAALPELDSRLTSDVLSAAALPRVLFLRAQLARGERTEPAALWSSAEILWLHADAELRAAADSFGAGLRGRRNHDGRTQRSPTDSP